MLFLMGSSTALRLLRAVAETGSFTAAAEAFGYTQSAVSRRIAVLERAAGARLFERRAEGVRPTPAGTVLLRHASTALDAVDFAGRVLHGADPGSGTVRLGTFKSVGAVLVPEALALMRRRRPDIEVITREGSTPALIRSLRASTLDLAVISARPPYPAPDEADPPFELDVLLEGDLLVAVPALAELGRDGSVTLDELRLATWIASPQTSGESGFGVWPALPQRPKVGHQTQDWLSKLALVAAGWGGHHAAPVPGRPGAGARTAGPRIRRSARHPPRPARPPPRRRQPRRGRFRRLSAGGGGPPPPDSLTT
ncbi:LysR family transcriptional regulator [Streptomyces sp. JW3]|uniref:LysR family transcriptional regulator n=1 Tax=Streptomyces sp. JW3 TaxID=3456955 RepID=UPI003FA419E8